MPAEAQHTVFNTQRRDRQQQVCVCVLVCMHECVQCVTVYRGNAWRIGVAHSDHNISTSLMRFSILAYMWLQVYVCVFVGCVGGVGMHI